jgi:hypothetical protein
VEGEGSRNEVEVLPHSGVKARGEEVFHQGDGHVASASTSRATRNLNGEDGDRARGGAESLVQVISKLHGSLGEFGTVTFNQEATWAEGRGGVGLRPLRGSWRGGASSGSGSKSRKGAGSKELSISLS